MKLTLSKQEIEVVLIEHATKLGLKFNEVEWDAGYSTIHGATLEWTDLPPEKAEEE